MPPPAVKTIRDLIYWQYSKIIAKSSGLEKNYGFIMSKFMELKKSKIKISDIVREDKKMLKADKCCIYCNCIEDLTFDHIIPLSRGGPDMISNQVLACKKCNSSKSDKDIFEWYGLDKKDEIPRLVMGKYLKLVYDFHEQNGTLDRADLNKDGKLNVLDLGIFNIK